MAYFINQSGFIVNYPLKEVPRVAAAMDHGDIRSVQERSGRAEPFMAKGCLILIDDINDDGPIEGTREFLRKSQEQYLLLCEQYTGHRNHPTFWNGVALLQKMS